MTSSQRQWPRSSVGWSVKVSYCCEADVLVPYPGKPSGIIRSNKMYRYTNNTTCIWRFSSNARLHLFFFRFTTQSKGDYLEVYDRNTRTSSRLLGKFSGISVPLPITSNSTQLYARFITDGSGVERGFVARYTGI